MSISATPHRFVASCNTMQTTAAVTAIPDRNLFVPAKLGKLTVTHDGREFSVIDSRGLKSPIQRAYLTKDLRGVSSETLQKMLDVGYLSIKEGGENYTLSFKGRLPGGGLLGAMCVYVGTNIAGGAMIIVGSATLPLGGVVLVAAGTATIAAAPYTFLITAPFPTP